MANLNSKLLKVSSYYDSQCISTIKDLDIFFLFFIISYVSLILKCYLSLSVLSYQM